jgi:hypothetical protein
MTAVTVASTVQMKDAMRLERAPRPTARAKNRCIPGSREAYVTVRPQLSQAEASRLHSNPTCGARSLRRKVAVLEVVWISG